MSNDIYKELNAMSLDSIYQKANRDLEDFKTEAENSITFKIERNLEEVQFEATFIIDLLTKRVKQIEFVIDDHIAHLHGAKEMYQFEELSYEQKLRYLLNLQNNIAKNQRMRMVDITQSYDILNSI